MSDEQTNPPADDDSATTPPADDSATTPPADDDSATTSPADDSANGSQEEGQTLTCEECGQPFLFTQGEQEFYEEKGFTPPKRCKECRAAKKAAGRQFTKVTCAGCGKETEVPFVPSGDRPVYCRECFEANKR